MNYYEKANETLDQQTGGLTGEVSGYRLQGKAVIQDNGSALLVFTKPTKNVDKPINIKVWINPVDISKVKPFEEGGDMDKAITSAIQKELRLFKSLARQFETEEGVNKAFAKPNGFTDLVDALNKCIPDNVDQIEGRLVVGFNDKGYLSVPNRLQWDSDNKRWLPFFTTDPSQKLQNLPNNLTLEKVTDTEVKEEVTF